MCRMDSFFFLIVAPRWMAERKSEEYTEQERESSSGNSIYTCVEEHYKGIGNVYNDTIISDITIATTMSL